MRQNTNFQRPTWEPDYDVIGEGICQFETEYGEILERGHTLYPETRHFIADQFKRFKVNYDDILIEFCWEMSVSYILTFDPYFFFTGLTDVSIAWDSMYFQYTISDHCNGGTFDAEPSMLEVFRVTDPQYASWESCYNNPGVNDDDFFHMVKDFISDDLSYRFSSQRDIKAAYEIHLVTLYSQTENSLYNYIYLGVWASLIWMSSPYAKEWRAQQMTPFHICYIYGECAFYNFTPYSPSEYVKEYRPAKSCAKCGIVSACSETHDLEKTGDLKFYCQYCASKGVPDMNCTCGSYICHNTNCKHHKDGWLQKEMLNQRRFGKLQLGDNGRMRREKSGWLIGDSSIQKGVALLTDSFSKDLNDLFNILE